MRTPRKDNSDDQPIAVRHTRSRSMWCENCEHTAIAEWTQVKIYRNGREIEAQRCTECRAVQETEYYKGPTTSIKNRENKR